MSTTGLSFAALIAVGMNSVEVIFESQVREIRADRVVLDIKGAPRELANDFVWIFAGGTPPNEFLKQIGVQLGSKDLTEEAGAEGRRVA